MGKCNYPALAKKDEQRCCGGILKNPHMALLPHGERMRKVYNLFTLSKLAVHL